MLRQMRFPDHGGKLKFSKTYGITLQQWSQWERGRRMPNKKTREKLAAFFGIMPNDLFRIDLFANNETPASEKPETQQCRPPEIAGFAAEPVPFSTQTHPGGIDILLPGKDECPTIVLRLSLFYKDADNALGSR